MPEVATAAVSQDAAEVGARVAEEGGNAVDAAVASVLASIVTHPGMCSLGGGGFFTIWPASGPPVTVDGGHEMPGRGLSSDRFGGGRIDVELEYAEGVETIVGPGSVATPGALAACAVAAERYGNLPWPALVEPSVEYAEAGFPMPASTHAFLLHAGEPIYGHDPRSRRALFGDGRLLEPGETIRVEHLPETLRALKEEGVGWLYGGELGRRIVEHLEPRGGILTMEDLESYEARVREPVETDFDGWRVAANPPPAVGGAVLAALLGLSRDDPMEVWSADGVARLVRVQEAVLGYRKWRLFPSRDLSDDVARLMELARAGDLQGLREASSTLQVSTVDSDGTACSVTVSDGYGSGVVPPGTGTWLNNALGERDLVRGGYHETEPGTRLTSNMAPAAARREDGAALAVGSPGADRIPTAIFQVLLNYLRLGMSLEDAIAHPRIHVDAERGRVICEPGIPVASLDRPLGLYEGLDMAFGGVEAAVWKSDDSFEASADLRRTGGTAVGGKA